MKDRRKYRDGRRFVSLEAFDRWTRCGRWCWWVGRPINPKVVRNWQWEALARVIASGHLREAVEREGAVFK